MTPACSMRIEGSGHELHEVGGQASNAFQTRLAQKPGPALDTHSFQSLADKRIQAGEFL